jgi:NAD(P)H-dependent FMN reductase
MKVLADHIRNMGHEVYEVNLATAKLDLCDGRRTEDYSHETQRVLAQIDHSSGAIVGAPVYRASAPGVLKNLFDLLPLRSLEGKPVGIVSMGASAHHYLAVDSQLRPVLAWFGAHTLPTSVYLMPEDFDPNRNLTPRKESELQTLGRLPRQPVRRGRERHGRSGTPGGHLGAKITTLSLGVASRLPGTPGTSGCGGRLTTWRSVIPRSLVTEHEAEGSSTLRRREVKSYITEGGPLPKRRLISTGCVAVRSLYMGPDMKKVNGTQEGDRNADFWDSLDSRRIQMATYT